MAKEKWVVSLSYGEMILKGKNRRNFVAAAMRQLHRVLADIPVREEFDQFGKHFIAVDAKDVERTVQACRRVFGMQFVTPHLAIPKDKEAVRRACIALLQERKREICLSSSSEKPTVSFKVKAKRADKSFPMTSPEIAAALGAWMLEEIPGLRVDMKHPDITLTVEIREDVFVSVERYAGMGGLPAGSGGRGLLLLSGGIDSPAAGFALARRGLSLGAVHFHSYPFTSERAQDKALRLAKQMTTFVGSMRVFMINLQSTYTAIAKQAQKKNTTLLSRRMMMRIADALGDRYGYDALITGESLGQVASQTVRGIQVVNDAARRPILRPFIATDKTQIIELARDIGTYEISIEPFDDCCSIFAPEHPNTNPKLEAILRDEAQLDVEGLLQEALETVEIVDL